MKRRILILTIICFSISIYSLYLCTEIINLFNMNELDKDILFSVGFPRFLTALLIGVASGASGAILQSILRNLLQTLTFWASQAELL
ncbi:MAG: iron chelate uptake ABC transporter family permease subunit [Thermodesulfovibrionales bacterium]|nr:iron chelate uptake ABC transporter family permease subunit [Thermodesulfovibrionales bacterium]